MKGELPATFNNAGATNDSYEVDLGGSGSVSDTITGGGSGLGTILTVNEPAGVIGDLINGVVSNGSDSISYGSVQYLTIVSPGAAIRRSSIPQDWTIYSGSHPRMPASSSLPSVRSGR